MSLKIDLHKRNKKTIYNKFVFKNTKITSVICHADNLTFIHMQQWSSDLVIPTAKACIFLLWWTHGQMCIQNISYTKYCNCLCMYDC